MKKDLTLAMLLIVAGFLLGIETSLDLAMSGGGVNVPGVGTFIYIK